VHAAVALDDACCAAEGHARGGNSVIGISSGGPARQVRAAAAMERQEFFSKQARRF
jgi:hypothetical protein